VSTDDTLASPDHDPGSADLAVRAFVAARRQDFIAELSDWLRIPSISADPAYADEVSRSADWLAQRLVAAGFPTVEIWPTAGLPAVFAEWPSGDPDAPTVVVYGHHDVQPADPIELWETTPFEPLVRPTAYGEELVGRGAIDDKGQVYFHLLGLAAHLAVTGRTAPAVNLKLLVEGEEESGSIHFAELLTAHRERLDCDVVVVSDTGVFGRDAISVCVGMRGMVEIELDVVGPGGDLHSGSFGGAVPNPVTVLGRIVARLHDADGHVQLPGFYDHVVPLTDRERALLARLPFDESTWLSDAQSGATYGEKGFTTLERIWARPTAEVNGLWGGYTGPGGKTIIPSEAHVKLSFRLVADQHPRDVRPAFESWLEVLRADGTIPDGIVVTPRYDRAGVGPFLTPLDHPALQSVTRAMEKAFGSEVLYTREGGSGPQAALAAILEAPVVFLGVGLPDDRIHAPNEKADIEFLLKGAEATAHLWTDLATTWDR
jgi:acetylornithine deacetylase/succinyl-diaminopimelate desuccinylase-like protein